ncbi:MAG: hypothetical protein AAGG56_04875 [Pseudomonadota bacterium]
MNSDTSKKYLTVREGGSTGFWRGVAAGLAFCFLCLLAVTYLYPPTIFQPPRVSPEMALPPEGIAQPEAVAPPAAPQGQTGSLIVEAPAPLLTTLPPADLQPGLDIIELPAAPDVFDGGPAGSPSLFNPAPETGDAPALR